MVSKTLRQAILIGVVAISVSAVAAAADKKEAPALLTGANASMLSDTCNGCHGGSGNSTGPAIPTIAGLSKDYFVETMKGFASGDIPSTIMGRIAKGYSDEEIGTMADHFGKIKFQKAKGQKFDATLAKKGAKLHEKYCEKCHGDGGQSAEDDAGVLAGQWKPYVHWTLDDYRSDKRKATKKMKKKLKQMLAKEGDAGIDALLNYYASQQ